MPEDDERAQAGIKKIVNTYGGEPLTFLYEHTDLTSSGGKRNSKWKTTQRQNMCYRE